MAMNGSLKDIFDPTSRPEPRGARASLLVPLLVVALFVCHGARGGVDHQTVLELVPSASAGALHVTGGPAATRSLESSLGQPASHADLVAAALCAGLCASLLARLIRVSRAGPFAASGAVRRVNVGLPSPPVLPARAPTAPEVQVFRL